MLNRKNTKKGFSLIEVIIVMAIIGILVLLGAPKFMDYVTKSKVTQVQADMKTLESVIMADVADATANDKPYTVMTDTKITTAEGYYDKTLLEENKATGETLYEIDIDKAQKASGTKLKLTKTAVAKQPEVELVANEDGEVYIKKLGTTAEKVIEYQNKTDDVTK